MATCATRAVLAHGNTMEATSHNQPKLGHARRLQSLVDVRRRLSACRTPAALFAAAADMAHEHCGFDRALVLVLEGDVLRPASTRPLRTRTSDQLRRWVEAHPVSLPPECREMEFLRFDSTGPEPAPSVLVRELRLRAHLLAAIRRSGRPAAILVVDRQLHDIDAVDRALIELLAADAAAALELLELRMKARQLGRQVQMLALSSDRAVNAILGPVSLDGSHAAG
jgi:GAF domain-containing protein